MGLANVQAALARLFTDGPFRDRFFSDPVAIGHTLGLDDREAADLARLSRDHVARFAATLRRKRLDDARKYLPLTSRALGESFAPRFLAAIDGPSPPGRHRDDARTFADHLSRSDDPPWAADLVRYELACREAAHRRGGITVRRYRHPVGRLADAAYRGEPITEVKPRTTVALWLRMPGRSGIIHRLW